jgi:hypothetical protein
MSMKKSNDTIGNQTHDLPACSVVPQPIAPLRALADPGAIYNLYLILKIMIQKSCHKVNCNITMFATAFIYTQIQIHVPHNINQNV